MDRYSRRGRPRGETACASSLRVLRVGTRVSPCGVEILTLHQIQPREGASVARCAVGVCGAAGLLSSGAAAGARAQTIRTPEVGGWAGSVRQPLAGHGRLRLGGGAVFGGDSKGLNRRAWGGGYPPS